MTKAYLNIQVDTSGTVPTVSKVIISDRPASEEPGEELYFLWATVDTAEAETSELARGKVHEQLRTAAEKMRSFRILHELFHEEHEWEPELSDALGG